MRTQNMGNMFAVGPMACWSHCCVKVEFKKLKDAEFLDVHGALIQLVCRRDSLDKIAACNGEYDNVSAELVELCDGSMLGRLLFETHLAKIITKKVAGHIAAGIHTMMHAKKTISQEFFDAAQSGVLDI